MGDGALISDPDQLLVYESDGLTQYRFPPAAVVLPGGSQELQEVVRILHQEEWPFVPRGAGTGLSGGALAVDGAVVVATTRMNRILELDAENRMARVEPGVINAHLTREAAPYGLYYAPDPSSQSACTLGGNVAENSGGPHCLKYGVTSRYVRRLQVVLPSGNLVELTRGDGRFRGEGHFPLDLAGLFVGSEGCFGILTQIEVDLLPMPEGVRTLLAMFDSLEEAGQAVSGIIGAGLLPAALEIMDQETIRAVEDSIFAAGYPRDAGAALVVEFDGVEAGLDGEVAAAREHCGRAGATQIRTAATAQDREALWKGRKKAFGAMGRIAPDLLVQDATVPRTRLPQVLARIGEIGRSHGLRVANVFHAGDGNLHPNLLFDRNDPDELARVEVASREMMEVCIEAGGTITGEHGVGLDKRRYLPLVLSPAVLETMARVKEVFDPQSLCNPGKVLPDEYALLGKGSQARTRRPVPEPGARSPWAGEGGPPPGLGDNGAEQEVIRDRVARLLGQEAVLGSKGTPSPVMVAPANLEEAGALLRVAAEEGWPVRPTGGGGRTPVSALSAPQLLLSTSRLERVVHYEPADLTMEVEGGMDLGQLDRVLEPEAQWLPLDPPGDETATLGGVMAQGLPGPLVAGFGHPRDLLLGMTVVDGQGRILELGGRVVKNVAGFDLVRLLCGSRGALGFIGRVAMRLHPRPETDRTMVWFRPGVLEALNLGHRLRRMPFPVSALELVSGSEGMSESGGAEGARVLLRLTGGREVVSRVEAAAREACGEATTTHDGEASRVFWRRQAREEGEQAAIRISVRPSELEGCLDRAGWLPKARGKGRVQGGFAVHLTTGLLRMWETEGRAQPASPPTQGPALEEGGAQDRELTRRLIQVFDPAGVLPGRWEEERHE